MKRKERIGQMLVFGLVFTAISLALFASPVFVQKAKATSIFDLAMADVPGPFQRGVDHIGGAIGYWLNGEWVIEYLHYVIDSSDSPLSGDGHCITTYWWSLDR